MRIATLISRLSTMALLIAGWTASPAYAQDQVEFNYSGRLNVEGSAFSGVGQFKFRLFIIDYCSFGLAQDALFSNNGSSSGGGGVVIKNMSKLSFSTDGDDTFTGSFSDNAGYGLSLDYHSYAVDISQASFSNNALGDTNVNASTNCYAY